MKKYMGELRSGGIGGQVILVIEDGVGTINKCPYSKLLDHIVRHSPDGFNWGYGGSGPADTALSILTDCVGPEVANAFYQEFKFQFVAGWKESFEITEKEIKDWLKPESLERREKIK